MKKLALGALVLVVALVALIGWRIYEQERALDGPLSGSGVVEAVGVDLAARLTQRVTSVAEEASRVEAGAVVVELDCAEQEAQLAEAEARARVARVEVDAARATADAADKERAAAAQSTRAAGAGVREVIARSQAAEREAARLDSLADNVAGIRRDEAHDRVTALQQELARVTASRGGTRQRASASAAAARAAASHASAATLSIDVADTLVARARLAVAECHVLAPIDGVVERVYVDPGELARAGGTVARVVRTDGVRVTFYVPNADVGRVAVGQGVVVEADAFPERPLEGVVRRVGLEAEFTPRNVQTRSDRDRLVFPVEVDVANPGGLLRAGMPVNVEVSR